MTRLAASTYQLPVLPCSISASLTDGTSIPPPSISPPLAPAQPVAPPQSAASPPYLTPLKTAFNPLKQHPYTPTPTSPLSSTSSMPGAFPVTPSSAPRSAYSHYFDKSPSPGPPSAYSQRRTEDFASPPSPGIPTAYNPKSDNYFSSPASPSTLKRKSTGTAAGSPPSTANPTPTKRPTTVRRILSLMSLSAQTHTNGSSNGTANGNGTYDPSSSPSQPPSHAPKSTRSISDNFRPFSSTPARPASAGGESMWTNQTASPPLTRQKSRSFWTRRKSSLGSTLNSIAGRSSEMLSRRTSGDILREKERKSADVLRSADPFNRDRKSGEIFGTRERKSADALRNSNFSSYNYTNANGYAYANGTYTSRYGANGNWDSNGMGMQMGKRDWVEDGLGLPESEKEVIVKRERSPPPRLPELKGLGGAFAEGDMFGGIF